MYFAKKIDSVLTEKKFHKEKHNGLLTYTKNITPSVEYIFSYSEHKPSYYTKGSPKNVLLDAGIRFSTAEYLIQENNKNFLIKQGWKPEDFKPIKYPSICEQIFNCEDSEDEYLKGADKFEEYSNLSITKDELNTYKNKIITLDAPNHFSYYKRDQLAMRSLVFMYLDDEINESTYNDWFLKFPDLRSNPTDKWKLDQLKNWLTYECSYKNQQ